MAQTAKKSHIPGTPPPRKVYVVVPSHAAPLRRRIQLILRGVASAYLAPPFGRCGGVPHHSQFFSNVQWGIADHFTSSPGDGADVAG
eukprot:gene10863-biopygen21347